SKETTQILNRARAVIGLDKLPQDASGGGEREQAISRYNALMKDVEPDLVFDNIPALDQKYPAETLQERADRLQTYDAAFETVVFHLSQQK
ncbi:MAG: hypothetical protein ACRC33_14675, partial [Gemmataceae bacterium]